MDQQAEFDRRYISGHEICQRMQCNRVDVFKARARGWLPGGIRVAGGHSMIWERVPLEPHLKKWEDYRRQRGLLNTTAPEPV